VIEAAGFWIGKQPSALAGVFDRVAAKAQKFVKETWDNERLKDGGVTAASNESSVVLYGEFTPGRVLLTGDAGTWALSHAAYTMEQNGLKLQDFAFVANPASREPSERRSDHPEPPYRANPARGGGRQVLRIRLSTGDDDTHPRKIVRNAFIRRGASVVATQGTKKIFWGGFPVRDDYIIAATLPFSSEVEEYDL
jgi:hypothetical protein